MSTQCRSARLLSWLTGLACLIVFGGMNCGQAQGQTFIIQNQSNKVCRGLDINTSSGSGIDCIQIIDSTDITIENSQIGPCGENGINIYNSTATTSNIRI